MHTLTLAELDANLWASCGPAALAALLNKSLMEVRGAFPDHTAKRTWTNLVQMRAALDALGVRWKSTGTDPAARPPDGTFQVSPIRSWPRRGLVQVFFRGSWEKPGVPIGAYYQRSHWVAVHATEGHPIGKSWLVFDVNWVDEAEEKSGWLPRAMWEQHVIPELAAAHEHSTGLWWTRAALEVEV